MGLLAEANENPLLRQGSKPCDLQGQLTVHLN